MVRPFCFRQGKNLSKSLREALCSFPWHTHHIADVADLKFCLLLRSFFGQLQAKPLQQCALFGVVATTPCRGLSLSR
jgi:hypothetical protein